MSVVPAAFDLEDESVVPIAAVEPLTPPSRALIHVVTFKGFYADLRKASYGDYKLLLGIPADQKDLAWKLSDYDGRMLEIRIKTMAKLGENS